MDELSNDIFDYEYDQDQHETDELLHELELIQYSTQALIKSLKELGGSL